MTTPLNDNEKQYLDDVFAAGQALEQDTHEFMMEEGLAVDLFRSSAFEYSIDEVTTSLREKDLVYTETVRETIRDPGDISARRVNFNDTEFKTVDREYVYFTEDLSDVYDGK